MQQTNASAAVTLTRQYDPYGAPLQGATASGYAYTGREWDAEIDLYNYRARYYDPNIARFISEDPIGFGAGPSFYPYVANGPVSRTDPLGLWAVADDLAFSFGGAVVGLGGQALGDLLSGKRSGWTDYFAAALGGAAGGEALLYTGPVGAGAAGGFVTNFAKQSLKFATGQQCSLDLLGLGVDTLVGSATGLIPGVRIPGLTAGRGSYLAVYKQMATKLSQGQISNVSAKTAAKMAVGRFVDKGAVPGAGAAAAIGLAIPQFPGFECGCMSKRW